MNFNDVYNLPPRVPSSPGQEIEDRLGLLADGVNVGVVGVIDRQAEIDSFESQCNLCEILKRIQRAHDADALAVLADTSSLAFGDVSTLPTDLVELQDFNNKMRLKFDAMPFDIRKQSGFNFRTFLQKLQNGEFQKADVSAAETKAETKEVKKEDKENVAQ